jgi:hypothetical protein
MHHGTVKWSVADSSLRFLKELHIQYKEAKVSFFLRQNAEIKAVNFDDSGFLQSLSLEHEYTASCEYRLNRFMH